jgi:hypothetical protein
MVIDFDFSSTAVSIYMWVERSCEVGGVVSELVAVCCYGRREYADGVAGLVMVWEDIRTSGWLVENRDGFAVCVGRDRWG